ncbi:type 4a pilus biogenesis protein PilO [Paenibacillus hexagrammi]|uniref:Type IV pilus assembly protein PilO n=1 Tax=Paenibacillus hexagrammi TaxID=2908839 RepID=A0ABY3SQ48_9BACL|nr:type 4a pilus biogenesis protein PilO [Paenibacillus sp. YPD9-1]UJF35972.1 hypothetical protein L0M14_13330 [Paenibacillus sp. YPD9-1]
MMQSITETGTNNTSSDSTASISMDKRYLATYSILFKKEEAANDTNSKKQAEVKEGGGIGCQKIIIHRRSSSLSVVILFLVLFAFYYLLLAPSNDKISSQKAEMDTVNKQLQLLNKKISENTQQGSSSMKEVQDALPLWDNVEQLTLDLESIKKNTKVAFTSISYSVSDNNNMQQGAKTTAKAAVNSSVKEVKVTTSVGGSYDEIIEAITQLQKLPRLITVNTVNFGNLPKDSSRKLTVSLTFTAYFDPSYKDKVDQVVLPF